MMRKRLLAKYLLKEAKEEQWHVAWFPAIKSKREGGRLPETLLKFIHTICPRSSKKSQANRLLFLYLLSTLVLLGLTCQRHHCSSMHTRLS